MEIELELRKKMICCAVLTIPAMSCEKLYKKAKTFSIVKFIFLSNNNKYAHFLEITIIY